MVDGEREIESDSIIERTKERNRKHPVQLRDSREWKLMRKEQEEEEDMIVVRYIVWCNSLITLSLSDGNGKSSFSSFDLRDIEKKLASYEAQKGEVRIILLSVHFSH